MQSIAVAFAFGGLSGDEVSIVRLSVPLAVFWVVLVGAVVVASQRAGSGAVGTDTGWSFRWVDLGGLAIGVICQLAMIPALYAPLRGVWPETFANEEIEERARGLVERADGATVLLLWALVVIGAPVVEELFYRGLLQRTLLPISVPLGLGVTAVIFGVIHFAPVELPGLIAVGLVFGMLAWKSGRLGPAITAHVGFNAAGLWLVS